MSPKDGYGMANSVDPDQTAPRSSLIRIYTVYPGLPVLKLRIIMVMTDICQYLHTNLLGNSIHDKCVTRLITVNQFGYLTGFNVMASHQCVLASDQLWTGTFGHNR